MVKLLSRTLVAFPVALLGVAACGASHSGGPSESDDQSEGGTGSGSGAAASGSGSGVGAGTSSGVVAGSSGGGASSGGTSSGGTGSGGASSGSSGGAGSGTQPGGSSGAANASSGGASSSGGTSSSGAASSCTQSTSECQASNSGCTVGSYYLYDNQWNCGSGSGNDCGPESAYGCTNSDGTVDFVVTSNQPAGNTAVLSYPAMQDNFDSKPALSSFHTITATFAETSPHVGDYEVAWDCWFNDNDNEFMVWVDDYNQVPGGNRVATDVSLGGRSYDIWWSASSGTGGYVVFYANTTVTSGTVDLLQLFTYATTHGWLPASSTVDQLSFGIEVCSTNGQTATWSISDYSITTN